MIIKVAECAERKETSRFRARSSWSSDRVVDVSVERPRLAIGNDHVDIRRLNVIFDVAGSGKNVVPSSSGSSVVGLWSFLRFYRGREIYEGEGWRGCIFLRGCRVVTSLL